LREICPFKKRTPFLCCIYAALAGVLLTEGRGRNKARKMRYNKKNGPVTKVVTRTCAVINPALINRIPVMAPILAPLLGVHFFQGHISLKNGTFCPLFSHDSTFYKDTCLLIRKKKRRLFCMGRTFTVARTDLLHSCPFQLSFSWESNPARVKASGRGAKCYPILKIFAPL
jgi:hypothetical protein